MSDGPPPGRQVVIWRDEWLPGSETFIRNQMAALTSWTPVPAGLMRRESALTSGDDLLLFGEGRREVLRRKAFKLVRRNSTLEHLLARPQVALVHAHFGPDAVNVLPSAVRTGTPLVVTFHGFDATALVSVGGPRSALLRRRYQELFRRAARIVVVSEFMRDTVLRLGAPPGRTVLHYIGVPLPPPAATTDRTRDGVVFVGRLTGKKGVADLFAAVDRLPEPLRSTPILLGGDGVLRGELEETAARLGLRATFLGALPPGEVRGLMAGGRVLCAPSRTGPDGDAEGLGMVFLEAGLARLPVVSYRHGGVPEAVVDGRTGLLAPEGDVATLSASLARVLTDDALANSLGAAGEAHVRDHFDIRVCTAALERTYDEAAATAGR